MVFVLVVVVVVCVICGIVGVVFGCVVGGFVVVLW